jgi:hypothetical protein
MGDLTLTTNNVLLFVFAILGVLAVGFIGWLFFFPKEEDEQDKRINKAIGEIEKEIKRLKES